MTAPITPPITTTQGLQNAVVLDDVRAHYSTDELDAALRASYRDVRFRYLVLSRQFEARGYLQGVIPGGTVSYNYLAEIKRTCSFVVAEKPGTKLGDNEIEWGQVQPNDLLKPLFQLRMPDGFWASWSLGVFLLDAGQRDTKESSPSVYRTLNGFDFTAVLNKDATKPGDVLALGAAYTDMLTIMMLEAGISRYRITASTKTLPAAKSWDVGTKLAKAINDLLEAINYGSVFFDTDGYAILQPYVLPEKRDIDIVYIDNETSIIGSEATDVFSLWDVPNRWILTVSQSDRAMLTSKVENLSPSSPTSIPNRGYAVTYTSTNEDAADQAALTALAKKKASEDSQVYRHVNFTTALMPTHGEATCVGLSFGPFSLKSDKFMETEWSITCQEGSKMTHTVRKVVDIEHLT